MKRAAWLDFSLIAKLVIIYIITYYIMPVSPAEPPLCVCHTALFQLLMPACWKVTVKLTVLLHLVPHLLLQLLLDLLHL